MRTIKSFIERLRAFADADDQMTQAEIEAEVTALEARIDAIGDELLLVALLHSPCDTSEEAPR